METPLQTSPVLEPVGISPNWEETYNFNEYLPPYRSLVNPNRCYDYRSHRSIDLASIGRSGLNLISNTRQKLLDAASDTLSIRSFKSKRSSVTVHDLPNEVLLAILGHLDRRSVITLMYVDRRIYELAQITIYREPYVTTTFRLAQLVQTLNQNRRLALLVKRLNLSRLRIGMDLTEEESAQYAGSLVFASSGGAFDELDPLLDGRPVLAGWRDFKFRFNPLYGDINREITSTSFVSPHDIPDSFKRNPIYSASAASKGNITYWNEDSVYELYDMASGGGGGGGGGGGSSSGIRRASRTSSSVVSSMDTMDRLRTRRSASTDATSIDEDTDSDDSAAPDIMRATSSAENVIFEGRSWSNSNSEVDKLGLFNSFRMFLGDTVVRAKHRVGSRRVIMKQMSSKERGTPMCSRTSALRLPPLDLFRPFATPHPPQSRFLKQYRFARDVPIGYLLHLLRECKNLEMVDLSGIAWSYDFELDDFEYFDWATSRGSVKQLCPCNHEYRSMLPGEAQKKEQQLEAVRRRFRTDKPVYWSDTVREVDFRDPALESLTIESIWPAVCKLRHLKELRLVGCRWLEKDSLKQLVLKGRSRRWLQFIDCTNSGLVKNSEWAGARTAREWRHLFRGDARVER